MWPPKCGESDRTDLQEGSQSVRDTSESLITAPLPPNNAVFWDNNLVDYYGIWSVHLLLFRSRRLWMCGVHVLFTLFRVDFAREMSFCFREVPLGKLVSGMSIVPGCLWWKLLWSSMESVLILIKQHQNCKIMQYENKEENWNTRVYQKRRQNFYPFEKNTPQFSNFIQHPHAKSCWLVSNLRVPLSCNNTDRKTVAVYSTHTVNSVIFTEVRDAASNSVYSGYPELWILRYPAHRYHAMPLPGFEPTTLWLRVRDP
jgi:hypothetical protein